MRRLAALMVCMSSAWAAAEEAPSRVADRVFFGLSGGASQASLLAFTDVAGTEHRSVVAPHGWKATWSVGIWPAEWIGLELATSLQSFSVGSLRSSAEPVTATGRLVQVVPGLRLALPLRYVAPFVGVGYGVAFPVVEEQRGSQAWKGTPGILHGPRFFGGANVYFSRDLRFFIDVEVMTLSATAQLDEVGATGEGFQRFEGMLVPSASIGFAVTPDVYKQSPRKELWVFGALVPAMLAALFGYLAVDGAR